MAVVSMVVGATTPSGASFVVKVDGGGPVRVAVSSDPQMSSPVFTDSQAVDAQGVAKVSISGLAPSTRYWWQVEDNGTLDTSVTGRFRTHPPLGQPASFTIAAAACAGSSPEFPGVAGTELAPDRVSNHPVFDTIRERDPLMFVHMGDLHYYDLGSDNHGIVGGGSLANYRTAYDDVLAQPRQHQLYREVPLVYIWDDHDFGPDNSDGTLPTKANAAAVYRERVPHYPLADPNAIYQSWQIGRVLFIACDVRYNRSPNDAPDNSSKTILGAAQKAWLADLLSTSTAEALVWITASQWIGSSTDSWAVFTTERDELAELFASTGWARRMVQVYGDRHGLGLTGGATNAWGGWPILQAASLDSSFGTPIPGLFDVGPDTPGRGQFGTITVSDLGSAITIRLTGWQGATEWASYTMGISVPTAPSFTVSDITRVITGSHRVVSEARLVTSFQTGDDPDGEILPIIDGSVQLDGTAQIRGSLTLTIPGRSEDTGQSTFPRVRGSALAPFGAEVFVRRGVDLGAAGVLWVPLGYYRIDSVEQDDAPYGPLRLIGYDRMAGIIDARLLSPRSYPPEQTIAGVFADLVGEIYPGATITFDDSSGSRQLGRTVVTEDSRYDVLLDLTRSLGKIMFWDGQGILRIEDPPDEDTPVWEVNAGEHGVLITARRWMTRRGIYNAVVATGEGGDDATPIRAVAVDHAPGSPTRFGGPFGQVPRFYQSTLITTHTAAVNAATALLRRSLGAPYAVDFGAIVNPGLKPYDPIRVTYADGTREIHVLERLTIPLVASAAMSGTTRERAEVLIGELP